MARTDALTYLVKERETPAPPASPVIEDRERLSSRVAEAIVEVRPDAAAASVTADCFRISRL